MEASRETEGTRFVIKTTRMGLLEVVTHDAMSTIIKIRCGSRFV